MAGPAGTANIALNAGEGSLWKVVIFRTAARGELASIGNLRRLLAGRWGGRGPATGGPICLPVAPDVVSLARTGSCSAGGELGMGSGHGETGDRKARTLDSILEAGCWEPCVQEKAACRVPTPR